MRAPNNKPTEKTEQRLARERQEMLKSSTKQAASKQPASKGPYMQMDLQTLLKNLLNTEEMRGEIQKEATRRLDSEEAIESVKSILSEYFTSFMVLGYDVNGKRTIVKYAKTDRDEDSILELLRYVIMRLMQG